MAYKFVFNPLTAKFDVVNVGSGGPATIQELYSDPVTPSPQDTWVLAVEFAGAGDAMGIMGLTYSGDLAGFTYKLSYRTIEGTTVRTDLD